MRRIIGAGDLWVTEYVLTYDGRPSYTVSIMEFLDQESWPLGDSREGVGEGEFAHYGISWLRPC